MPVQVFLAEGGVKRRRSAVSLREIVGLDEPPTSQKSNVVSDVLKFRQEQRQLQPHNTMSNHPLRAEWRSLAEEVYETKSVNYKSNYVHVTAVFQKKGELVDDLDRICPKFRVVLSHILQDRIGIRGERAMLR